MPKHSKNTQITDLHGCLNILVNENNLGEALLFRSLLLENVADTADGEMVCKKITAALEEPMTIQKPELYLTASIGVPFFPTDDRDITSVLRNLEICLSLLDSPTFCAT